MKSSMPVCRNRPNSYLFSLLCTLYNCTCKCIARQAKTET